MPKRGPDLFSPVAPDEKLHRSFRLIMKGRGHRPARRMMQKVFDTFKDPDGNFVEQFQTTGFDSRVWELYLYAYLVGAGFSVNRDHTAPDFLVDRDGTCLGVEAVTANPSATLNPPSLPSEPSKAEMERIWEWVAIRLGGSLFSKLNKQYWNLPHVAGRPFVLAIENFSTQFALLFSDSVLATYLYGNKHDWEFDSSGNLVIKPVGISEHSFGAKRIPSGFFDFPDARNISAVLFSNSGTVAKFNRMGHQGDYRQGSVRLFREGTCHNPDPNATSPLWFEYEVGDARYRESWGQGLSLFHNPRALHPVPKGLFAGAAEHRLLDDGQVLSDIPAFHPYGSVTKVVE